MIYQYGSIDAFASQAVNQIGLESEDQKWQSSVEVIKQRSDKFEFILKLLTSNKVDLDDHDLHFRSRCAGFVTNVFKVGLDAVQIILGFLESKFKRSWVTEMLHSQVFTCKMYFGSGFTVCHFAAKWAAFDILNYLTTMYDIDLNSLHKEGAQATLLHVVAKYQTAK